MWQEEPSCRSNIEAESGRQRRASQVKRAMRGVWPEEGMAPEKLGWGQGEHGAFEDEKGVGDCLRLETEGRVTRGEAESHPAGPHKPR